VAVELITNHQAELPPCVSTDRVICFGYPLFGPNEAKPGSGTDRVHPLRKLPREVLVTFVSGERDEFLRRDYQTTMGLPTGIAALQEVCQSMAAATNVIAVEGGKHNCLSVGTKRQQVADCQVLRAVEEHIGWVWDGGGGGGGGGGRVVGSGTAP